MDVNMWTRMSLHQYKASYFHHNARKLVNAKIYVYNNIRSLSKFVKKIRLDDLLVRID